MRKTCLDQLFELARADDRIVYLGSDLGAGTLSEFKAAFPERFFMEGISEANLIGMAAGMAMCGKIPYVHTIATFFSRRALEQIAIDICMHNAPVRILANGGGMVYAPLGPTHEATEDIALLRPLPNMAIVCPADAHEMRRLMPRTVDWPGPLYIRIAKGFDPIVTDDTQPWTIGPAFPMREGTDAALISTGICLRFCLEAHDALRARGIRAAVVHVPTVKPLDAATIVRHITPARAVVTVEEHSLIGGLGSAVAELMAESGLGQPMTLKRIGIADEFSLHYGSQRQQLDHYGISCAGIVEAVTAIMR